nr:hypothetical protein [Tanacetum cinerariifolium]
MPLFPSPEPKVSCIDDLDFFKDFENEFPAVVYNDALTSKLDFSTEPTLCPQHIDEFDLKDETSLSDYDEVEQNVSGCYSISLKIYVGCLAFRSMLNGIIRMVVHKNVVEAKVEGYTEEIVHDFEQKLETIFKSQEIFMSHAQRRLFEIRAPLVHEFILEFFSTYRIDSLHIAEEMEKDGFKAYWLGSERVILDKGNLSDYWVEISSGRDFLRGELVKLNIYREIGDDWVWVAQGTKRQPVDAVAASVVLRMPQTLMRVLRLTKIGSKFGTIACEYVMEPSTLPKSKAELRRESVYKSVEAGRKV